MNQRINPVQELKVAIRNLGDAYTRGKAASEEGSVAGTIVGQALQQIHRAITRHREEADEIENGVKEVVRLLDESQNLRETIKKANQSLSEAEIKKIETLMTEEAFTKLNGLIAGMEYAQGAYFEIQSMMNGIIRSMKEIPQLESEIPKDNHPLIKVEFPEDGGVLTYMEGQDYPYKGFPFFEFVDKIDLVKKASRGILSALYHIIATDKPLYINEDSEEARAYRTVRRPWWQRLIRWLFFKLAFSNTGLKYIIRAEIYTFARFIDRFKIKSHKYSDAVREVYRAYSVSCWGETEEQIQLRLMMRDLFCMYLECDNAYRFRFQDLFLELDKEALRVNPQKELKRVYDIAISREIRQEIKDTWILVKWLVDNYLVSDKDMLNLIVDVSCQIDPKKVELDDSDKSYCRPRGDYVFKFMEDEKIKK